LEEIRRMGETAMPRLEAALGGGYELALEESTSQIGSGALPTEELPTRVIVITHAEESAQRIAEKFRRANPPILGRIKDDRFLLDLRTIFDPEDVIPRWDPRPLPQSGRGNTR
jgi:L-seryl-tRNA(Ser) seleniumtransferase